MVIAEISYVKQQCVIGKDNIPPIRVFGKIELELVHYLTINSQEHTQTLSFEIIFPFAGVQGMEAMTSLDFATFV